MIDLRKKFTKWYYHKGYTMKPKTCDYFDGVAELVFRCPWWVRPLAYFLFSPSVYYAEFLEELGNDFADIKWTSDTEEDVDDQSGMENT